MPRASRDFMPTTSTYVIWKLSTLSFHQCYLIRRQRQHKTGDNFIWRLTILLRFSSKWSNCQTRPVYIASMRQSCIVASDISHTAVQNKSTQFAYIFLHMWNIRPFCWFQDWSRKIDLYYRNFVWKYPSDSKLRKKFCFKFIR